jgi:hypothetical protein
MRNGRIRKGVLGVAVGGALLLAGCTDLSAVLSQDLLDLLGGGSVATLPGNAPAVLLAVENAAEYPAEVTVSYRTAANAVEQYTVTIDSGQRTAQALACPITEMTVGDLSDPAVSGVVVRLGAGTTVDPFVVVEPFGVIMKEGANFDCGDSVTFRVVRSSATLSGYRVFAFVQRAN